jgi:TRAP-type uncharacterized transport system fused permease subunit
LSAIVAIWLWSSAMEGYLYRVGRLGWPLRGVVMLAGLALIYPEHYSDFIGVAVIAALYLGHWLLRGRRATPAKAGDRGVT